MGRQLIFAPHQDKWIYPVVGDIDYWNPRSPYPIFDLPRVGVQTGSPPPVTVLPVFDDKGLGLDITIGVITVNPPLVGKWTLCVSTTFRGFGLPPNYRPHPGPYLPPLKRGPGGRLEVSDTFHGPGVIHP